MARIRTIKPDFFRHYDLYQLEKETGLPIRVAFAGLWTVCDREGRFKWVPPELKIACTPYDECDFSRVLDALCTREFVVKYTCNGREFGYVPSFKTHQVINNRESESVLPDPNSNNCKINDLTRDARVNDASATREVHAQAEGKEGREGKGREGEDTLSSKLDDAPASTPIGKPKPKDDTPARVIEYLNTQTGKKFQPVDANLKLIRARIAEGATWETLTGVVDLKCAHWLNDPKMHEYLRPSTLFNAEKYNQYVGLIGAPRPRTREEELDEAFGLTSSTSDGDDCGGDIFDGVFQEVIGGRG